MSENKSIEALQICVNGCKHTCPYYAKNDCIQLLKADLLDAFKRQNAIIEELTRHHQATLKNLEEAHLDIKEKSAEIERLEKENKNLLSKLCQKVRTVSKAVEKHIKAEAVKEFAGLLKQEAKPHYFDNTHYAIPVDAVDNLVKERVGEK